MKTTIILSVLILLFNITQAQSSSNDLLKKIPDVPTNVCVASNEKQNQFEENISVIIRDVDSQIKSLKKQSQPDEDKAKAHAEQMLKQQGLSQEEIDKMKSKKMTKDEKQAMADKMMQQYTNMSMSEVNSMKNMSKEGKQAYMEGYATEAQATAQANAKNNNAKNVHTNNNADVLTQRNELVQKITAQQQDVNLNYQKIEQDAGGLKLMEKMNSLRTRMGHLVGSGGEEVWNEKDKKEYDAAKAELNRLQKEYCQYMSPLYINALNYHFANLQSSYSDYQKLDEMTGKIDNTIVSIGTTGKAGNIEYFDWVKSYLQNVKDVYKYHPVEE
jgi:hypothetical protein